MTTIREAICEALDTRKGRKETEQDFIARISSDVFSDEQWEALAASDVGTEAQEFANAVTAALKDETDLPGFPDEVNEDSEEAAEEESEEELTASEDKLDNEEQGNTMNKKSKATKKERTTIKDRMQKIADMASTMTMNEIATELEIGYQTVQQTLSKLGIKAIKKAKGAKAIKTAKVGKAAKAVKLKKAAKANGKGNGVRGEKIKEIVKLLTRSGGCTSRDVLDATGWPTVSMPAMAKQAGLILNKKKVQGEVTRYSAKAK